MAMIEESQVIAILLAACPSFRVAYPPEGDQESRYAVLGEFARHLLQLYRNGDTAEFSAIALALERLHLEGSQKAKELATVGCLEAIQNAWSNAGEQPELFVRWLLPETRRWWAELNDFWAGRIPYVGAGLLNK